MSTLMDEDIKRWTAKRKSALVLDIIQGKTTVAEASRTYDLPPSEIETWVDDAKAGMENALRVGGRQMIETIRQGLEADGYAVSISQLCRWFGVARRTVYSRPTKAPPTVHPRFAAPIKALLEEQPSFGYRTVAHLLGFNKNTVQRVFQVCGWQVRNRPVGFRPRVQAMPSVAMAPNTRWATDLCRVWTGRDGWASLASSAGDENPG